jgi:hypothetical protein
MKQKLLKIRIIGAWALLIICIIGWPISMLTVAKEEPPFVLSLSWLALILTCIDILSTQDVASKQ